MFKITLRYNWIVLMNNLKIVKRYGSDLAFTELPSTENCTANAFQNLTDLPPPYSLPNGAIAGGFIPRNGKRGKHEPLFRVERRVTSQPALIDLRIRWRVTDL